MNTDKEKQYSERNLMDLDAKGNHYCRHVMAMTSESLHSKSDIAAELGWRDLMISELKAQLSASQREFRSADITMQNLEAECYALAAENAVLKAAHPQPFGPEMMKALDAYEKHQDEVPETGMLNAFFILRDSIRVETPATDAFLAEVRAQGVTEYASKRGFSFQNGSIHAHFGNGDVMVGAVTFENGDAGINFAPVREKTGGVGTSYEWTRGKTAEQVVSTYEPLNTIRCFICNGRHPIGVACPFNTITSVIGNG